MTKVLSNIALTDALIRAYSERIPYFAIVVSIPNAEGMETIIFGRSGFLEKIKYYNAAYDENLFLKANEKVFICDFYPIKENKDIVLM